MSYKGPNSIPGGMAKMLIGCLNPILDLLAEEDVQYKSSKPATRKVEENRWILWRAAMIAHEAMASANGYNSTNIWLASPVRERQMNENTYSEPWYKIRCGRPTKKDQPCKAPLRRGRAHCWRHSTVQENEELRLWQDKIHLPYPRVKVDRNLYDMEDVIQGLQQMCEALS